MIPTSRPQSASTTMAPVDAPRAFGADADSVKTGVFVRRRAEDGTRDDDAVARGLTRRLARRSDAPTFERVLKNEREFSREGRARACAAAWEDLDARCQAVADDAHGEAFRRVEDFVRRCGSEIGDGTTSVVGLDKVPSGVVLAGGVNSDDHEETFAALTRSLRRAGEAHCALLRSRDLKARGSGTGGGGLSVAFGVILRQLDRDGRHWGGKSMRAVGRWYAEASRETPETLGDVERAVDGGSPGPLAIRNIDDGNEEAIASGVGAKKRARGGMDSSAASPSTRRTRRRAAKENVVVDDEDDGDDDWFPIIRGKKCPVVIVVEDTESFDARVLDSFLRSISEYASRVPVVVLLGLATSVSSLQGMLPASTAALLDARAFQLWSPGRMMEAVQERVLLSPELAPAFGSEVLSLLHTRFKEHDFSLAAVRRALHLLTLTHFMTEPLSAVLPLLAKDVSEACADGEDSDDEYGDAIDQFVRSLGESELEYARMKHGIGRRDGEDSSHSNVRDDLCAALRDVYRLRRRWELSLRCIQVACVATEEKVKKIATTKLADLLLDASRTGYFSGVDAGPKGRGGPGDSLIKLACARVCDEFSTAEIGNVIKSMLKFLDEDEVMRSSEGSELRFLLSRIEEGAFNEVDAQLREAQAASATTVREYPTEDPKVAKLSEEEEKRRAIELLLANRKRRGGAGGGFSSAMTPGKTHNLTSDGGLVLPHSPVRGRSAPAPLAIADAPESEPSKALALVPLESMQSTAVSAAANEFCDILRAIARKYASRPPESLPASGIFVVTDVECVRAALQASPRLALENTLTDPSEILACSCCRFDNATARHRIPASLPDAALAYRLLARFGEQAPIYDWFQIFCECKSFGAARPGDINAARGTGTFGLPREKLWELQARFTRAVAELEFLGIARPYQKGRKRVEYMVRTAFPLDKLARDAHGSARPTERPLAIAER